MPFYLWSTVPGNNATADPTVNWAEGQAPSTVNDSARAGNARLREWANDISGAIVTGGSSTAYSVASYQVFDTLAHLNGQMIAFTPHTTSGGTCTLNVDGLGAKPLRSSPSVDLQAGVLIQGTPYCATYNNTDGAFYLRGFFGSPYSIPLGGLLPYIGATAPNSAFALPFGQAVSRTTYAAMFALVGTAFGSGDGTTTFNLPDLRGRVLAGLDNMGGSAANRITSGGSGIAGTTLGASGGAETVTLAQANLPNIVPTFAGTQQTVSANQAGNFLKQPPGGGPTQLGSGAALVDAQALTFTFTPSGTISSINGNVTQTAINKMPPAIVVGYLLRVL